MMYIQLHREIMYGEINLSKFAGKKFGIFTIRKRGISIGKPGEAIKERPCEHRQLTTICRYYTQKPEFNLVRQCDECKEVLIQKRYDS